MDIQVEVVQDSFHKLVDILGSVGPSCVALPRNDAVIGDDKNIVADAIITATDNQED